MTGEHKEDFVGTLNVSQYSGNTCNSDVYFPSEIPTGVGVPNEPLLMLEIKLMLLHLEKDNKKE